MADEMTKWRVTFQSSVFRCLSDVAMSYLISRCFLGAHDLFRTPTHFLAQSILPLFLPQNTLEDKSTSKKS
jgi:hypothetical protein